MARIPHSELDTAGFCRPGWRLTALGACKIEWPEVSVCCLNESIGIHLVEFRIPKPGSRIDEVSSDAFHDFVLHDFVKIMKNKIIRTLPPPCPPDGTIGRNGLFFLAGT
jgi:hypothetical protein